MKNWTLAQLKSKPKILDHLKWDAVPAPPADPSAPPKLNLKVLLDIDKLRSDLAENVGYWFCVEVWHGEVALVIKERGRHDYPAIAKLREAPEHLLWDAVVDSGGAKGENCEDGEYAINDEVKSWLKVGLE